jgi:hypothetical protein
MTRRRRRLVLDIILSIVIAVAAVGITNATMLDRRLAFLRAAQ